MKKTRILSALLLVSVLCGTLSSCVFLFRFWDKKPWTEDKIPETFFDADYLAERGVADFPLPPLEGAYLDPESDTLYLNLSRTEYEAYAEVVAAYLRGKEDFPVKGFHCGNDDHFLMFLPMKEYQFASLDVDGIPYVKENERLFVFSKIPLGDFSDGAAEIKKPTHVLLEWDDATAKNVDEPYTAVMTFPDLLGKSEFLSCYHGHDFEEMTYPVPGTVLTTTFFTCTRCGEEEREGYGYGNELKEFSWTVVAGTEHLVSGVHASAWRGSLVEIALKAPESGDLKMTANGTEIPKVKEIDGQWFFAFIMPYSNIEITIEAVEHKHTGRWLSGEVAHWYEYTCGCPSPDIAELHMDADNNFFCDICGYEMSEPPTNYFLRNQAGCEWLQEITAEDIAEIEIICEAVGVAPGTPKNISSSTDKAVIARVFEEYYWLDTWPISKENGEIDGGGAVTPKFILKDGTEKQIYINNGNYCDTDGNYFDLLSTPNFKYGEDFTSYHTFVSYEGTALVNAYTDGDAEVINSICTIPMDELRFIPFEGSIGAAPTYYPYYIHTELGDLVFHYNDLFNIAGTGQYYQLIGKNLDELICEYSYRMHEPMAEYVSIRKYYGRFASGALVAMIDSADYPCVVWEETVGNTVITYGDGNRILVLYNGDFYTLPEAYTAGYLTDEDLTVIAKLHTEG